MMNARGYTSTTTFDEVGRTRATEDALGNKTTYGYDAAGHTVAMTNALGYSCGERLRQYSKSNLPSIVWSLAFGRP